MTNPQTAFIDLLVAAMTDAAVGGKLTQLQSVITPEGHPRSVVRIVVIPENMDRTWPKDQPLGTHPKGH